MSLLTTILLFLVLGCIITHLPVWYWKAYTEGKYIRNIIMIRKSIVTTFELTVTGKAFTGAKQLNR